jgi:hypothetical protein
MTFHGACKFHRLVFINSYSLHDDVQSAYCAYHSTETALLRVHHDIAYALDSNCCAVLLMLDLSAAFDTIDHQILFNRLEYSTGVTKDALLWFKSYLMDRTQSVAIGSVQSDDIKLRFGVPQGSVSYMHQLKLAIEFDQCYESAENMIL